MVGDSTEGAALCRDRGCSTEIGGASVGRVQGGILPCLMEAMMHDMEDVMMHAMMHARLCVVMRTSLEPWGCNTDAANAGDEQCGLESRCHRGMGGC